MRHLVLAAVAAPVLLATSAFAADLPRRNFAPSPSPVYAAPINFSWTGFYAGVNAGYGFGSYGSIGNVSFGKPSGASVGGTLGYNYQINSLVIGAEGDLNWTGLKSTSSVATNQAPIYYTGRSSWMGTARVRAGFAADRALVYATAGYAGAAQKTSFSQALVAPVSDSVSSTVHGWALGGGIEYAFTNAISVKAEYLYVALGKKNIFGPTYATQAELSGSIVRAGVNYHF